MSIEKIILFYFICINLITFLVFGIDKRCARKNTMRISEQNLFILVIVGGAAGAWIGMYLFRHKTKHWSFIIFIPLLFILQAIGTYFLLK